MRVVTESELSEKIKNLTETKLQIRLEDGEDIFLSLWTEHEYQLEAFEETISDAARYLKDIPLKWVERIEDDSEWADDYRKYREEMDEKLEQLRG